MRISSQVGLTLIDNITPNVAGSTPSFDSCINLRKTSWTLDYGAIDHICFDINNFSKSIKIKPIRNRIPNGNVAIASHACTFVLIDKIRLHNFLYLPQFSFNLLYISKLC